MQTIDVGTTLFVDGLALSVTSEDLRELFMSFGSVAWCRVARDHCGISLRLGYVAMDNEDNATRATEALNGTIVAGLQITVTRTTVPPLPRIA
ncbi:RNA recognition motif domain-containing protein [Nitrospira sp. Nam74]